MGIIEILIFIAMIAFLEFAVYELMTALRYICKVLIRKIKRK